ncbi:MAG TPA: hypothetical protein VFR90_03825 [Methylibium sp.]|uniref:hypothetical protein n=1 Tax=Methylibium sp. TaxID=2067992 RepID=UPI002DB956C2|nr:hypothetical protein [Methylibium sp.]HEU4458227.1 hypothetical protein [Methylibium sp.]
MTLALWLLTAALLGLWSLAAWGLHRLLSSDAPWLVALPERLDAWLASQRWAGELDRWWPGWQDVLRFAAELAHGLLGWLGDGALWIVWIVWGLGAAVLLGGAALLAWLIGYAKRHATPPSKVEQAAA